MSYSRYSLPVTRTLGRLRGAFWRRRVVHWWIRALWLALLVPTVVVAGYLWWGWQVPWYIWLFLMLVVGIVTIAWSLRPISLTKMTRRLDKLLGMRAQLVTALEVSQGTANQVTPQGDNPVVERLVQDTVNVTVDLRRQIKLFGRGFWLEMHALIAIAAILGAMLLFDVIRPDIPNAPPVDLPPAGQEPQADQVIPPDVSLQQPPPPQMQALSSAELRSVLQRLADALRDQAITYSVAEAIDRNDLDAAAESLRRLADQLEDLSEEARSDLSDSLQEAADSIGSDAPNLTEPLQRGSQALEINNLGGAGQAVEDLAGTLEELGETTSQSDEPGESGSEPNESGEAEAGAEGQDEASEQESEEQSEEESGAGSGSGDGGDGDQEPGEEEERLPIDGQPLELESDPEIEDRVLQPSELDARAGEDETTDSPFTRQPLNAAGDDLGPDPLAYPWQKRAIIRDYFTP